MMPFLRNLKRLVVERTSKFIQFLNEVILPLNFSAIFTQGFVAFFRVIAPGLFAVGGVGELVAVGLSLNDTIKDKTKNFLQRLDFIINVLKALAIVAAVVSFLSVLFTEGQVVSTAGIGSWIGALAAAAPIIFPVTLIAFAAYHLILGAVKTGFMIRYVEKGNRLDFFMEKCFGNLFGAFSLVLVTAAIVTLLEVIALPFAPIWIPLALAVFAVGIGLKVHHVNKMHISLNEDVLNAELANSNLNQGAKDNSIAPTVSKETNFNYRDYVERSRLELEIGSLMLHVNRLQYLNSQSMTGKNIYLIANEKKYIQTKINAIALELKTLFTNQRSNLVKQRTSVPEKNNLSRHVSEQYDQHQQEQEQEREQETAANKETNETKPILTKIDKSKIDEKDIKRQNKLQVLQSLSDLMDNLRREINAKPATYTPKSIKGERDEDQVKVNIDTSVASMNAFSDSLKNGELHSRFWSRIGWDIDATTKLIEADQVANQVPTING